MLKRIALSLSTIVLTAASAQAATNISLGDTFISASNLALNQSIAGIANTNNADTLNTINFAVSSDSPVNSNSGILINLKYDSMTAATTTSINNHSLAALAGMQFYDNEKGHYLSAQGRLKETNYPVMKYNTIGIGANLTGLYNLNPVKLVGMLDYDSQNGPTGNTGATYRVLTTTILLGGSPWAGGNVYIGPSVSALSNSVDPIFSGIVSVSQKFDRVTGTLSYMFQSKGAATGNMVVGSINYTF